MSPAQPDLAHPTFDLGSPDVSGSLVVFPVLGPVPVFPYVSFAEASGLGATIHELEHRASVAAEALTYQSLLHEIRSAVAHQLLDSAELTVSEVAARLGYHDAVG